MKGPDTFVVEVPDVGSFECRRRTMRVAIAITAEYNRLTEGAPVVSDEFNWLCSFVSYLKVMIVEGPEGWNVDEVNPDSEEEMATLNKVYREVKAAEARFRAGGGSEPKAEGEGA